MFERLQNNGKLFRDFQKCFGRFREVPRSLWKYPEGYGTLQNTETEARPSWKVHKVVGRLKMTFLGGQAQTSGTMPSGPRTPDSAAFRAGIRVGLLLVAKTDFGENPCPNCDPRLPPIYMGARVAPKTHQKSPKVALAIPRASKSLWSRSFYSRRS